MTASILFEDELRIPYRIDSLAAFRQWAFSEEFPESGRIDYVDGSIEVDSRPDNLFYHSAPKTELGAVIRFRLKATRVGHVFIDNTRVSCPDIDLSVEPDVVVVSHTAIESGRVRLIPAAAGKPGSYLEIEGPPDLVVEVVSPSSVAKDTRRLRKAYFDAGVEEYWLADARGTELRFEILVRGEAEFIAAPVDSDGFQASRVLAARYRFERATGPGGLWEYELTERL